MKTTDLKPRAIAVLCALRSGPKTANQLARQLDAATTNPARLLTTSEETDDE